MNLHTFCTKIGAPSTLVSYVWTKYKDEVPDVSGSNQNIETSCKNKLKLTKPKDLCFEKKMKRWMHITAILKLWSFSGVDIIPD